MRSDFGRPSTGAVPGRSGAGASAAEVLKSFNTWSFKREQPSDDDLMLEVIERRLARGRPVSFVLYWGKGPRADVAAPERQCLAYLRGMGDRIRSVDPAGACFSLCLTDTHARLNGHSEASIDSYFAAMARLATAHDMRSLRLSDVVAANADAALGQTRAGKCDEPVSPRVIESLERCAMKWYRGADSPATGARRYLAMNMVERRAIEAMFPDSIFVTFNGRAYRDLFPAGMPIFYMYSLKRGTSVKPWFMDAEGNPFSCVEASFG